MYRGEIFQYGWPGHIKSSANVPARTLLEGENFAFKLATDLAEAFRPSGVMDAPKVVNYCGRGISATTDLFALALFGH